MTISKAFDDFYVYRLDYMGYADKTKYNYRCALRSFLRYLGDVEATEITFHTIVEWKKHVEAQNMASATIQRYICCYRQVLKYLKEQNYPVMDYKQIIIPRVVKKEPKYIYPKEVSLLIESCTSLRDKALIAAIFSTGCRIAELLSLDIKDLEGKFITVNGKGNKIRTVMMDEPTRALVNAYILNDRFDSIPYLFVGNQGKRLSVSAAEIILDKACKRTGIDITPHGLRHSYATDLAHRGMNLKGIQDLLGHTRLETTQMYIHNSRNDLLNMYNLHHSVA